MLKNAIGELPNGCNIDIMACNIWWIRRDIRLEDNPALIKALESGLGVIPLFIMDPYFQKTGHTPRFAFLINALRDLDARLRSHNSRLVVRTGQPDEILPQVLEESHAVGVFAETDHSPYSRRRDAVMAGKIPLSLVEGPTLIPPGDMLTAQGNPYQVFTPFYQTWKQRLSVRSSLLTVPERFPNVKVLETMTLPDISPPVNFPATRQEAQRRLDGFLEQDISLYADQRDRLDLDGTSLLSPYIRFGLLSIREVFAGIIGRINWDDPETTPGEETWLKELAWREFYQSILLFFPEVLREAFRPQFRDIPWRDAPEDLLAWQSGLTGYPVVDAGMRQLMLTGWMHNRARMITASFLVKDLLINWQAGERWFMQRLVDGDPASNNGGWQWTAGVGTDAAPYFRIFNPILQGQKFDPHGVYIRRWVPELADVPERYIHQTWLMPEILQRDIHCRIGIDYPLPVVDHKLARRRTLDAFGNKGRKN